MHTGAGEGSTERKRAYREKLMELGEKQDISGSAGLAAGGSTEVAIEEALG